jgi:hypothetical protein
VQQESRKPKDGAKLQPGTEERLQWGKPVNGLRAALVIRPSSDESKAREMQDLYLVVQKIEQAQAGAWTGKLVTGETSGAVAAGKPKPFGR